MLPVKPSPPRAGSCRRAEGFTLIELMVTVIVLAITMAIAFPSFTSLVNSNRLTGAANELVGALQAARSEALRRNDLIRLCRSEDGATCAAGIAGDKWPAWVIVNSKNAVIQSGIFKPSIVVVSSAALPANALSFRPDGFARSGANAISPMVNAQIAICIATQRPVENRRLVTIGSGSRFMVLPASINKKLNGTPSPGACDAPTDM